MQGVILSAGTAQGIILGDDGVRYTFTPLGWRHDTIRPEAGMRVDFEARGSHAVGIYPVPGAASTPPARPPTAPQPAAGGYPGQPTQPPYTPPTRGSFPAAQPSPTPQVATGGLPPQPPPVPPAGSGGGMKWLWALAGAGAIVVLGIIGAFALGIFPARPPAEVTQLPVEAPSPASPPQVITPIAETLTPPPTTPIGTGATGRIAFHSDRDGDREIYVMNADGSDVNKLTDNSAWDSTPAWSPDGQRIAFVSGRDGNIEIYVMNADGSDVTRLTDNSANDEEPSWSPDGQRIAFVSGRDGNAEIYVMNANGSDVTRLTDNSAADLWPSWSPDGRRIAFTSGRDGNIEIYVMNADGSDATRLTDNSANDEKPSWSPDGQRIAFVSGRDGNAEIYVMNADGSDATRLTDNSANDEKPSWSPDGQRIAFVSGRDGNAEIYVMNADGSDATRLTDNSAYDELPAWSTSVASVATSTVPPTPTPIPIKEVNFAGLITSTNLPSQIQVVFSLRDQRGHAIVLPAEEIERETKVFERGRATDNNWEEIDYTETSFFVHTAENIDLEMVFALDFTNSMSKTRLPNGDSGIQAMLSAFDSALAVLPSAHRIGVVEFHDRNSEPGILSALTTDRAAIRESVSRFANSAFDPGSSRVWDSIVAGSELFSTIQENPRAVRVLVFLSDGRDTSSASDRDAARRFAQARKVQLYALGVGDVFQDVQLRKMAKDTDGRYYDVSDISLLQEQLQLLVNDLRGQYQLSYITLRRSGDYKIRMEVEVANIPGSTDVGPFNVASFFGPDNQGVIHFDPPSLDRANNRSTLFMRALHIPRNIDRIRFKLDTSNPVHVEPVSRRNGGLLDGWTLTGPDSTGFYEASSSQPIEFGNFGPMFKLTISGVTEQTPPDIPFEFDNSIYTDGKSLSHPPHVSVAPPPISSP